MGQFVGYFFILLGIVSVFYIGTWNGLITCIIGVFLVNAAQSSYQQVLVRSVLSGVKVHEIMSHPVTTVNSWLTLDEIINDYFMRYRYSSFPVIDDGVLKGYVTLHDAKQIPRTEWMNRRVKDILRTVTDDNMISDNEDAVNALNKMVKLGHHKLLVLKDQQVVGILTLPDLLSLFKIKTDLGE